MNIVINSSTIISADYAEETETLIIRFRNGRDYIYYNVPKYVFEEFINSPSKGQYFNLHIKGRYQ